EPGADRHRDIARRAGDHRADHGAGAEGGRADVRRRLVPADGAAVRSDQPDAVGAAQPDGARHDRQAHLEPRVPDVLAEPEHDLQRSDRAARGRGKRSRLVDPLAQRGSPDLRAGVPRASRLLMRRVLCALCVRGGASAPAAAAVADYLGKPIASVRLVVEGREATESVLTSVVETRAGSSLSMAQVRESIAHLYSLGRFEGVSVDATLVDGRVALTYELVPIHPVSRIRFGGPVNAPGIDTGAMRRAIVDRYGGAP